jgi:glycosyltransferase involved in cell wall biosynthesis
MTPNDGAAAWAPAAAPPRLSVIVPSYNSGAFLREALTSAVDQDPPPDEVVVQDGGSTDETLDILRSFGQRVMWDSEPDDGQSDALNKALARVTGDVVLWLNADDVVLPGAIAAASAAFASDPDLAFAYGDFDMIDRTGTLMRRYRSSEYSWDRVYARGCYIFSGSLFVRRQHLEAIGGFDPCLHGCMDLDLLLRLDAAGRSRHLGRTTSQFRMHDASKSSTIGLIFLREGLRVRRRYAGRSPRLWLIALWATARTGLMEATAPLRYSPRWPRHGGGKTL